MHLSQWPLKIFLIVALVALTGCAATPTPTVTFQRTRGAFQTPTDTSVPNTPVPSATPQPTSTPAPTNTPNPTATPNPAQADLACNSAEFAQNVTIYDGTKVGPYKPFTKSWMIRNTGTCTWTSDYTLVYVNGTRFGGDTAVSVPGPIPPGSYVTLSANLTAPLGPGTFTSYWMMKDPSGQFFGFGPAGKDPLHVTILIMVLGVNSSPTAKP